MNPTKIIRGLAALLFYIFACVVCVYSVCMEHFSTGGVSVADKLLTAAVFIISLGIATVIACSAYALPEQRRLLKRVFFWALFAYYVFILLEMLFFDVGFGRAISNRAGSWQEYLEASFNLNPLETISIYIQGWQRGYVNVGNMMINIAGNLLAFVPMGLLLPVLFPRMRRVLAFILVIAAIIVLVELMQMLTMTGSCDIDDFILNMLGALTAYALAKLPFIRRHIEAL